MCLNALTQHEEKYNSHGQPNVSNWYLFKVSGSHPEKPVSVLILRGRTSHIGAICIFLPCLPSTRRSCTEVRKEVPRNVRVMSMGGETNCRHHDIWDSCSYSGVLGSFSVSPPRPPPPHHTLLCINCYTSSLRL